MKKNISVNTSDYRQPGHRIPVVVTGRNGKYIFGRSAGSGQKTKFRIEIKRKDTPPGIGSLILVDSCGPISRKLWRGRIVKRGAAGSAVASQENLVKLNHEVPAEFPPGALTEAESCAQALAGIDLANRQDLRSLPFVTIDGANAKDFDDAIYVEKNASGWILWVAIADVSHFVRPRPGQKNSLDAEAARRGNSWYFPVSVEPMLPFAISNNICSLEEGKDRLVILVELRYSPAGVLLNSHFTTGVIRSHARLTYEQAQEVKIGLNPGDGGQRADIGAILSPAFELYETLSRRRNDRGMLNFNLPEAEYQIDDAGKLVAIGIADRTDAHRMIEEFMLSANEAVAEYLEGHDAQFLYRVHPAPNADGMQGLYASLRAISPDIIADDFPDEKLSPREAICAILDKAKGADNEFAINRLCLRAMPQACYTTTNEGHFGLASSAYCHFTSPIRRYADLLVHRVLKTLIGSPCGQTPVGAKLAHIADRLNHQERAAVDCEREIHRRLGCLFLSGRTGERFSGTVSGVTPFGVFVLLDEVHVEGLIKIRDLADDFYTFNPDTQTLTGESKNNKIHIGQRMNVLLTYVDMLRLEARLIPDVKTHSSKKIQKLKSMPNRHAGRRKNMPAKKKWTERKT